MSTHDLVTSYTQKCTQHRLLSNAIWPEMFMLTPDMHSTCLTLGRVSNEACSCVLLHLTANLCFISCHFRKLYGKQDDALIELLGGQTGI